MGINLNNNEGRGKEINVESPLRGEASHPGGLHHDRMCARVSRTIKGKDTFYGNHRSEPGSQGVAGLSETRHQFWGVGDWAGAKASADPWNEASGDRKNS